MQGLYKNNLPRDIKLYLAKPNREIIAPLKFAYQRTITWNESSPSELSFSLPYEINVNHKRVKYSPTTQLKEKFLIKAVTNNYEEWFIIGNLTKSEDEIASLTVNCLSAEQALAKKKLIDFKRTSYNPMMILNDILPGTGFKVGYINPNLNLKYREFDISSTSKLDFIYTDMTDTYEALVVFDTVDKTVSLYEKNELSNYKGFIVNDRRYLMGIENDIDTTELVTRLHVTGSDGLGIQSVNPTGQRYIDDFSYFLYPFETDKDGNVIKSSYFMEDDLAQALVKYNEYVSGRKDEFKTYLDKKADEQQELTKLQNELFDTDTDLKTVLDTIAWMKEEGLSTSDKQKERKELNAKIKKLNGDIKNIENTIEKIDEDIKKLGEDLKYEKHLSPSLLEQLNYFIHEDEWSDDNKIDPNDLYESGIEELKERNSPPVNISVTLSNFLKDAKAENDWKRLNLSDIIRIQKNKFDIDIKIRVSSITIDFDTPSIELELSNYKELNSLENKLKSAFYRINKVNTDFNKRKIDYDRVANNFNLRNDRIKEIPEEPTVGKNAIKHRKNNDGSVDITVKWTYPDYVKTEKKEHAIDGFMLYFHNDTTDEVYQFTSQMANEQITSVPYPTRTFVYPSVPADLFYTIGVRAYRRVDPDVNRDGILMSPIIRFNDGVGGFDEVEGQVISTFSASVITPFNEPSENDDISSPYRPEEFVDFFGKINGSSYKVHHKKPDNPEINDVWINSADGTLNIWNGDKWQGNQILADLGENVDDLRNATNTFENELREKLEESQKAIDEAMERVDSELERIENEVVPEVEQAVKDTFIPRQDYPPDPENLPPSGMWQDITQDPPRMMRWDPELGEWVPLAPNEEEIDEMIDKVVDTAKQEYREYTDEEIQKQRDRIMAELDEKESILSDKVAKLLDKAEGMYDRVDEIDSIVNQYGDKFIHFENDIDTINNRVITSISEIERIDNTVSSNSLELEAQAESIKGKLDSLTYNRDKEGILESIEENSLDIKATAKGLEFKADSTLVDEIEETITGHTTELSLLSTGLKSKVDEIFVHEAIGDAVDDIRTVHEHHTTLIEQNSQELSLQAESIINIQGDITTANSSINVLSDEINNRVKQIDFENETGALKESISNIRQLADGIEQTVSNIEIGTMNLITHNPNNWENGYITVGGDNIAYSTAIRMVGYGKLRPNTEYTITNFTSSSTWLRYREYDENQNVNSGENLNIPPNESLTFITTSNGHYFRVYFNFNYDVSPENIGVEYRAQLVEGNMKIKWSPPLNDYDERMSISESVIKQLSDDILLKVERDGVSSAINLNPQGVLIDANKVDITGMVSFINNDDSSETLINGGRIITKSISTSQLEVDQIFSNSAVIAKIQSDSVLTAKLSATNIITGILDANNINVVNLSASSLVTGVLDANKVTVQNLDASSIRTGVLSAVDIEGVNVTGSSIISTGGEGSWIRLANGRIDMMSYGDEVGYIRPSVGNSSGTKGMSIVGMRDVFTIGFDNDPGFGGTSSNIASWNSNSRTAIISGADTKDWTGRLRLRSSYSDRNGSPYVPHIDIDNNTTNGIPWGNIMVYAGRNNNSPTSNSRYGLEVWQYKGTGDGSATQMFKTDYSTNYSSYITDVADKLSIGSKEANNRKFMIKYEPNVGTTFQTLAPSNVWQKRLVFNGDSDGNIDIYDNLVINSPGGALEVNGLGYNSGVILGSKEQGLFHSITQNSSNGSLYMYVQRYTGANRFTVRSHHRHTDYRDDLSISNQGTLYVPGTFNNTTTNSPTVRVGTSAGHFTNTVSARKYKVNIETAKNPYRILDIDARTWFDKGDAERLSEALNRKQKGESYSFENIERIKRIGGLIAEEVEEAGLSTYVDYNEKGEINGVAYDRIWTLLIPIVRDHNNTIEKLNNKIDELEEKIKNMEEVAS